MIRVLTLNTWGTYGPSEREAVLLEAIRASDPDVLCLQEVTQKRLLEMVPHPTCLHAPESGLAIVSRFPEITHRVASYQIRSPLESYCREALMAQLKIGNQFLWVVTTHLAWMAEDEFTRLKQVEELLRWVAPLGTPLLLSGDFNAEPPAPSIQRIREAGFLDLYAHLHPEEPGVTWDNQNPFIQFHSVKFPDRRIDYLFLKQESAASFHPIRCEVTCRAPSSHGLHPSDHYGVMADLAPVHLPIHR